MNTKLQIDVNELNAELLSLPLEQRLELVLRQGFTSAKLSSSLGQEDQLITARIATSNLPISIFTLDTGRLFRETELLISETEEKYKIKIERFYPDANALSELEKTKGLYSFYNSVEERVDCCNIRKVEPLKRALSTADLWLTGLRSDQSQNRKEITFIEYDERWSLFKFNPIVDYTFEQVQQELTTNNIPQNPLHELGYISIGCRPCTRAVYPDEDIRAGRWWWEQSKKECGLHR